MGRYDPMKMIAQTEAGLIFTKGMQSSGPIALAINPELGLLVLGQNTAQNGRYSAQVAVEILLDDLQLNLSVKEGNVVSSSSGIETSQCFSESFENINEYLISSNAEPVSLSVLHFSGHHVICAFIGNMSCLMLSNNKLSNLTQVENTDSRLGLTPNIETNMVRHPVTSEVVLISLTSEVLQAIGSDHIRLTLSRFKDNLDMAMRQINTRAAHCGIENKPALLLSQIPKDPSTHSGWLNRLRGR